MKNVAIVTLYGEYNLGNKLQNYAVEYLLRELGCTPTTLVTAMHQPLGLRFKYFLLDIMSIFPVWKDRRLIERRMMRNRRKVISEFSQELLHCSRKFDYGNVYVLKQLNEKYDLFITGSDQVWGSFIDQDQKAFDYYFLRFTNTEKRGTISPSFGRNTIPLEKRNEYTEVLTGIRWLSCREKGAEKLIKDISGQGVQLLLDPTMAVPIDVWRNMERRPDYEIPSQYVLDYRLGTDKDTTDLVVKQISRKNGYEIINIYNTKTRNKIFEKTGPKEFLWLIDNAALVVTDSFHGCVFSILFKTDFICIDRSETSETVNMSDRLDTLLARFGLEDRYCCNAVFEKIESIDYSSVDKIISDETGKIRNFLQNMIAD